MRSGRRPAGRPVTVASTLAQGSRRATANGSGGPRLSPPGRSRSLPLAALGVLVAALGAVVFGALYLRLDTRDAVLAVARPVPAGKVLSAADVTSVRLSHDGALAVIPVSQRDQVMGRTAAVALTPGSLLTRASLGSASGIAPGQAVVGLALKANQMPAGLRAGDRVTLVTLDRGEQNARVAATALPEAGMVVAVAARPDVSGVTVVSVALSTSAAAAAAAASAQDLVSLILLPPAP